jgi:hypothetical protein
MSATATRKKAQKNISVWDQACELEVHRRDPIGIYDERIDSGANYFVLMLEQLGAKTDYSCSGHVNCPNQFYIIFSAPLDLAERIVECGYFTVELERRGSWSLRTRNIKTEEERIWFLRMAAEYW